MVGLSRSSCTMASSLSAMPHIDSHCGCGCAKMCKLQYIRFTRHKMCSANIFLLGHRIAGLLTLECSFAFASQLIHPLVNLLILWQRSCSSEMSRTLLWHLLNSINDACMILLDLAGLLETEVRSLWSTVCSNWSKCFSVWPASSETWVSKTKISRFNSYHFQLRYQVSIKSSSAFSACGLHKTLSNLSQ